MSRSNIKKIHILYFAYGIVAVLMIVMAAAIWPVGIFGDDLISRTAADYSFNTGPIGEVPVFQEFVPKYERLKTLGIDIGKVNGSQEGIITYHILDGDLQQFASFDVTVKDMRDGELTDIPVNLRLVPGNHYYVGVDCRDYGDTAPVYHYRSKAGNGPEENITFYYGGTPIEDASANIRYTYEIPLSPAQVFFYYSVILLLGISLIRGLKAVYDRFISES